jgi:hypothetical protein
MARFEEDRVEGFDKALLICNLAPAPYHEVPSRHPRPPRALLAETPMQKQKGRQRQPFALI